MSLLSIIPSLSQIVLGAPPSGDDPDEFVGPPAVDVYVPPVIAIREIIKEVVFDMVLSRGLHVDFTSQARRWASERLFDQRPNLVRDIIRGILVEDLTLRLIRTGYVTETSASEVVTTWVNTPENDHWINMGVQRVIDTHRPVEDLPLLYPISFPEHVSDHPEQGALATAAYLQHHLVLQESVQRFPLLNREQASVLNSLEGRSLTEHLLGLSSSDSYYLQLDAHGRWTFVEADRVREVLWINLNPTWNRPSIADIFLSPPLEPEAYVYDSQRGDDREWGVLFLFDPRGTCHKIFSWNHKKLMGDTFINGLYAHEIVHRRLGLPGASIMSRRSYVSDTSSQVEVPGYEMQDYPIARGWWPIVFKDQYGRALVQSQDGFFFEEQPDWSRFSLQVLQQIQRNIRIVMERLFSIGWSQGDGIQIMIHQETGEIAFIDWESFLILDQERFGQWSQSPKSFEVLALESFHADRTKTVFALLSRLDKKIQTARRGGNSGGAAPVSSGGSGTPPVPVATSGTQALPFVIGPGAFDLLSGGTTLDAATAVQLGVQQATGELFQLTPLRELETRPVESFRLLERPVGLIK
ncbi:MAG: hypothetical protein Q7S00_02320 [bacterium]|nr:hypothetical protein [bacterium]